MLKAESLVAGYGGRPVLNGCSIEVRAGEVLCVIGHNGAGKSTLMRSLFGLTRPIAGKIAACDGKLNSPITCPRSWPRTASR